MSGDVRACTGAKRVVLCVSKSRPPDTAKTHPNVDASMTQSEWRGLGVQQSRGWVHYAIHRPEPHIMLYRRKKTEEEVAR